MLNLVLINLTLWLGLLPFTVPVETLVDKVVDGDTFRIVLSDKQKVYIRLYGIDCPEASQPYGIHAKRLLEQIIGRKPVMIQEVTRGRWGRPVANVYVDGELINARMVAEGACWWYQAYAKKDKNLERLEKQAKQKKLGLWADPVPPWEYRKRKRGK